MATKMGYAPGVQIQLKDNSAYTVVQNPNTVAGIVGYASKGELNKIINVGNTAELGVKLGYGYQSYKYNQGMYAANAVLTTGGEVEFVRPYGEEISRTDPYKRDLKTDAFVVAFDKNAALYFDDKPKTSLNVKHFAATRYKTDGAGEFGVTRKINNIAETVANGKNVDFNVDASENFADSEASRKYKVNDTDYCTDMVLFSIMNRDPSYASRAYDRYEVVSGEMTDAATNQFTCLLSTRPIFMKDDTVIIPATAGKVNQYGQKGTVEKATTATVVAIDDKTVTIKIDGEWNGAQPPDVLIYSDAENAIADGFDYLNVKTAVAGNSVKNFATVKFGVYGQKPSEVIKNGTLLTFRDKSGNPYSVRLQNSVAPFADPMVGVKATFDAVTKQFTIPMPLTAHADLYLVPGDVVTLNVDWLSGETQMTKTLQDLVVVSVSDNGTVIVQSNVAVTDVPEAILLDAKRLLLQSPYHDNEQVYLIESLGLTETGKDTWEQVATKVAETISIAKKYSREAFTNDIKDVEEDTKKSIFEVIVDPGAVFDYSVGDLVAIVRNSSTDTTPTTNPDAANAAYDKKVYTITAINAMSGRITLNATATLGIVGDGKYQLLNLTASSATVYTAAEKYVPIVQRTVASQNVTLTVNSETDKSFTNEALSAHVQVGDTLTLTAEGSTTGVECTVASVDKTTGVIKVNTTASAGNYTTSPFNYEEAGDVCDYADLYLVSSYTLYVSKTNQDDATVGEKSTGDEISTDVEFITDKSTFTPYVQKSDVVLADSDIGASFLALGLAKANYVDINFDGNPVQVFTLTEDGIAVARMFMAVRYRFNGKLYEFEGTIVPYTYNRRQLGIQEAAEYELEDSGLEFVLNDSGVLDYFLENNSYDLSQTIRDGVLNGSYTAIAFNEEDPAIANDAVWTYDPQNNNSGSTLATVWNLFVNKDASDVSMLVAAGVGINNPFTKKYETLNTQVMQAMINVCESRKDCFCLFDGVYEPDITKAVTKMIDAGHLSLGRWGAIYDGRGVFQDSLYTNSQVDCMKSIQLAAIITANRQGGVFWIPPAGDEAYVPSAWGTKERFTRSYSSEDKNCDHAKLSDIHVNATRVNKDGIRIWGDFTCQMEDTAFNQIHVTMLVAGIHKMFYKYLDHKVFKLNTTVLRAQITSDLQDKLNNIKRQNPPGLIEGKVICDDTNNTPELIDQNFLIVELKLFPPKSTRWIILRTSVESTKNGKNITTDVLQA